MPRAPIATATALISTAVVVLVPAASSVAAPAPLPGAIQNAPRTGNVPAGFVQHQGPYWN